MLKTNTPSGPTLDEFMADTAPEARKAGYTDRQLRQYWAKNYGQGQIDTASMPAWDVFLPSVKKQTKDYSDEEIRQYWEEKYGDFGAREKDQGDAGRGFKESFQQIPQTAAGLTAAAGAYGEKLFGEGGASTRLKQFGLRNYKEIGAEMAKDAKPSDSLTTSWDMARSGNPGALVDWLQHAIGYGGGQILQMLGTAGVGYVAGKVGLKTVADTVAKKLIEKEAQDILKKSGGKIAGEELQKQAVSNVAGKIGMLTSMGAASLGMEGGEIHGGLLEKAEAEGRPVTGEELAKAFGSTVVAGGLDFVGDRFGLNMILGKGAMSKLAQTRLGSAVAGATGAGLVEGGTEFTQTLVEEFGKGNDPFSPESIKQALDAAGIGAVTGGSVGTVGGAMNKRESPFQRPEPLRLGQEIHLGGPTYSPTGQTEAVRPGQGRMAGLGPSGNIEVVDGEVMPDMQPRIEGPPQAGEMRDGTIFGAGRVGPVEAPTIVDVTPILQASSLDEAIASAAGLVQAPNAEMKARAEEFARMSAQVRDKRLADQARAEEMIANAPARREVMDTPILPVAEQAQNIPGIIPGQAFNPRGEPEGDARQRLAEERERMLAAGLPDPRQQPAPAVAPAPMTDAPLRSAGELAYTPGTLPTQDDLTYRSKQAPKRAGSEVPILEGPGSEAQDKIARGQAFNPKPEPTPPSVVQTERERLLDEGRRLEQTRVRQAEPALSNDTTTPLITQQANAPLRSAKDVGLERAYTSVEDLHRIAEEKGLQWDNNPTFMELTKMVTGKAHLDQLSPPERDMLIERLRNIPTAQKPNAEVSAPQSLAVPKPAAPSKAPVTTIPEAQVPRSELTPEKNTEMLLRAEKAKADMEIAGTERGGRFHVEQQGMGGTNEVIGLKSPTADWYKELTSGPSPAFRGDKKRSAQEKIEEAIDRIIRDEGHDRGAAVEKVKAALLNDQEFRNTPYGRDLERVLDGDWPEYIEKPASSSVEKQEVLPNGNATPLSQGAASPSSAPQEAPTVKSVRDAIHAKGLHLDTPAFKEYLTQITGKSSFSDLNPEELRTLNDSLGNLPAETQAKPEDKNEKPAALSNESEKPFELTAPETKQAKPKTEDKQTSIPLEPETVGTRPIIGREAQPEEAPLFSKAAKEPAPEQTSIDKLAEALRGVADQIQGKPKDEKPKATKEGTKQDERPEVKASELGVDETEDTGILGDERGSIPVTGKIDVTKAKARLRSAKKSARPYLLGALTLEQLSQVYGKQHADVKAYNQATQDMQTDFVSMSKDSEKVIKSWRGLKIPVADEMAKVMEDARFLNFDPDPKSKQPASSPKEIALRTKFENLPENARETYRLARDFYTNLAEQRFEALKERITRGGGTPENTKKLLDRLHVTYEKVRSKVYFPFTRFGEHIVVARKLQNGKEVDREVHAFEAPAEADQFATQMKMKGWTVKQTVAREYSMDREGAASKVVKEMAEILNELKQNPTLPGTQSDTDFLLDALNQSFLQALPDMSYAKHFIHARDVKGASKDALRAFAHSTLHGAHHISRIRHADKLTKALSNLDDHINKSVDGDVTQARQVYNELAQRHNTILNPNVHPVAAWLGQLGFTMSLGGVVATGVTNATQVPLVTYPWLGARFGFGKASAALARAYKDFLDPKTLNADSLFDASKSKLISTSERKMLEELQKRGRIDLTQTMDLAGLTSQDNFSRVARNVGTVQEKVMRLLGFTFHAPEVMNRQVTALAAFRLEKERGGSYEEALQRADDAIKDTHFIYTADNRARYMSGNVLRVLTMFKQYSQHIAYTYGRAASVWLDKNNATKEERAIAKRQLISMLGLQYAAAGALGMPFFGTVTDILMSVVNAFGDDDDKTEWEVALRKWLDGTATSLAEAFGASEEDADKLGKWAGEVAAHGVSRLTPWDMAARLGQQDLFIRAPQREREGRAAAMDWLTALAGPVVSYFTNAFLGTSDIAKGIREGNAGFFLRGVEELTPAVLRHGVKSIRYGLEDVRTRDQDKQLELKPSEALGQVFGFQPARVAEMYEATTAIKNKEHRILNERKSLLNRFARAHQEDDEAAQDAVMEDIEDFNERHEMFGINSHTLNSSLKSRARREDQMERGMYLPPKRRGLLEEFDYGNY